MRQRAFLQQELLELGGGAREIVLTELGADWVLDEIEGARGKWLQLVLSKPLFCDAKFTYSNTLFERLCADAGAWERIVVPKSKA